MLTQWFDPEPGPASLPGVYAREFVRRGHAVHVLTGFPNYPDGVLFPGYRIRPRVREKVQGVDVTRVALYPNHSASALGRAANYSSFALSATVAGGDALRGADAVWVYNSPVTVSLPLLAHTRGGRTPVFLHVQDLWPDSLIDSGMFPSGRIGAAAAAVVRAIVRATERQAAVIGVSSRSVRDLIVERHPGLDERKIIYAPNPTDEGRFRPAAELREELGIQERFSGVAEIMYAGAVGEVQGLDTLVDAAGLLRDRDDIRITIVGDGISRDRLERRAKEFALSNVSFLGRVPQASVPELIARASVQLVSLGSSRFLSYTTPSKISSLLASEVPIIGHIEGDGARLLEDAGAGVVVTPGDAEALASAISGIADGGPPL
jgi:glycosyltransferase involved in cell wall biosynthesis